MSDTHTHIHTHTHIYVYILIYTYVYILTKPFIVLGLIKLLQGTAGELTAFKAVESYP